MTPTLFVWLLLWEVGKEKQNEEGKYAFEAKQVTHFVDFCCCLFFVAVCFLLLAPVRQQDEREVATFAHCWASHWLCCKSSKDKNQFCWNIKENSSAAMFLSLSCWFFFSLSQKIQASPQNKQTKTKLVERKNSWHLAFEDFATNKQKKKRTQRRECRETMDKMSKYDKRDVVVVCCVVAWTWQSSLMFVFDWNVAALFGCVRRSILTLPFIIISTFCQPNFSCKSCSFETLTTTTKMEKSSWRCWRNGCAMLLLKTGPPSLLELAWDKRGLHWTQCCCWSSLNVNKDLVQHILQPFTIIVICGPIKRRARSSMSRNWLKSHIWFLLCCFGASLTFWGIVGGCFVLSQTWKRKNSQENKKNLVWHRKPTQKKRRKFESTKILFGTN